MSTRPLSHRLVTLSVFWIALALAGTAIALGWTYREHVTEHYDAHVFMHVEELIAAIETDEEGRHSMAREPSDPRFYQRNSGWYWVVLHGEHVLFKSASLGTGRLRLMDSGVNESHGVQTAIGPRGEKLRAHVVHISYPRHPVALTIAATVPAMSIRDDVGHFSLHLLGTFLLLGVLMGLAVYLQVRLALKPLRAIQTAIGAVKSGEAERLPDDFPSDVQPVVDELNKLIDHNETLLRRARAELSDLAHSVKNPLTVIRNEARKMNTPGSQLILDHAHATAQSIDHCLTRARVFGNQEALGYRTSMKSSIEDLRFAMQHVHKDREIDICFECEGEKWFRGEQQDLDEMIGNLLDNACKWARRKVVMDCTQEGGRLRVTIEDDGPGIPEERIEEVLGQGVRLDQSRPGHGQGLRIVRDIAELYGGSLSLSRSKLGGLEAALDLPSA